MKKTLQLVALQILAASLTALSGCGTSMRESEQRRLQQEAQPANRMLTELCKSAGEKIYRTDSDVEGIFLVNVRSRRASFKIGQFELADPYWDDYVGEDYVSRFLWVRSRDGEISRGFPYVETIENGDIYRYRLPPRAMEEMRPDRRTHLFDQDPLKEKVITVSARYSVEYEDISTLAQRELWIAGSSLRVRDRQTGELMAERIGYMADLYQGDPNIPKDPWIRAMDVACPAFDPYGKPWMPPSAVRNGRAARFVQKVLEPLFNGNDAQ